jgi:hypothetical protein
VRKTLITSFLLLCVALITVPIAKPFWDEYRVAVRDCVDTQLKDRTLAQQENCEKKGKGPIGSIIPGVL